MLKNIREKRSAPLWRYDDLGRSVSHLARKYLLGIHIHTKQGSIDIALIHARNLFYKLGIIQCRARGVMLNGAQEMLEQFVLQLFEGPGPILAPEATAFSKRDASVLES